MEFANINFMQPLLSEEIIPDTETAVKELVEKYSPVRQRTVRGETIEEKAEGKAGALPPAVYSKEQGCNRVDYLMEGLVNDLNTEEPIVFTMDKEGKEEDLFVHATSEGGDTSQVTFVDDCLVAVAVAEALPPPDEYETDSGDDFSDREDEDIAHVTVSRSGQPNIFCLLVSSQRACCWASTIFPDHFISANHN